MARRRARLVGGPTKQHIRRALSWQSWQSSTARAEAKRLDEEEAKESVARVEQVQRKLGAVLLEDESAAGSALVSHRQLDIAFVNCTQLLGESPTALVREWKTGQTVMAALNGLQGQDETEVFSTLCTRKAYDLYLDLVKDLTGARKAKPTAAKIATEWNVRVRAMLDQENSPAGKKRIREEYGFIGAKNAHTHTDRLSLRTEHVEHAGEVSDGLLELCSEIKQLSVNVAAVAPTTSPQNASAMQRGSSGPGAQQYQASALQPPAPAVQSEGESVPMVDGLTKEEVQNTCFICKHLLQKPANETTIKDLNGNYVNGHSGERRRGRGGRGKVICSMFDTQVGLTD